MSTPYCLAWECVGRSGSVCALAENGTLLAYEDLAGVAAASHLVPCIDALLRRFGRPQSLAVAIGPGSFTGLRISTVAARTLAWCDQLPLIPVPTLAALACDQGPGLWYTVLPLKKDVTFHAAYSVDATGAWQEVLPVQAINDDASADFPPVDATYTAVGPALASKPQLLQCCPAPSGSPQAPTAHGVARAARSCQPQDPAHLLPAYHRASAPELQRDQGQHKPRP
ncbi:MAG: tRNA (adenosine(37)-N6)-threonylcarbamoyltransferase complex dimerization subunit type 1 TsaB [Planctomycetota bacterium]|nr:MAG: tRNA (adenosine(37)-N6)-threonylcarbamoyltransferase complex dimerization subunit type 1 TsaB [Planctomycetota bacterium]